MPKYPYYSTIHVSPEAQAYIASRCKELDVHPTYVYALAQIAMDLIGETSRARTEQFAVAYAATAKQVALTWNRSVHQMQVEILRKEANLRLAKMMRDPEWVAHNQQAAQEELSILDDLWDISNPLYGAKL